MSPREASLEATLVRAAKARGVWAIKFIPVVRGLPDRILLAHGARVSFVELKQRGKRPTRIQAAIHTRLRRLGFLVEVIDHPSQVAPFFEEWLDA